MITKFFLKKGEKSRLSPHTQALLKIADINISSANCTLIQTTNGETKLEDLGRALFLKTNGQLMIQGQALFISIPEEINVENRNRIQNKKDILSLWFLHDRIPRTLECRVEKLIRFSTTTLQEIDPKVKFGYKLTPLSDLLKQDNRSSLRFSHQPGEGSLPVFPQILFDVFVSKTNQTYPTQGSILPIIENPKFLPLENQNPPFVNQTFNPTKLIQTFKKAMRSNPLDLQAVHLSKPYLEERLNRSILIELGFSDVLGLGSMEVGRNLYIKKPTNSWNKNKRDPRNLNVNDTIILHYRARAQNGEYDYYELITEISRGGFENLIIRPVLNPRKEIGMKVPLVDFSVNGIRFQNSPEFLSYILDKNHKRLSVDQQLKALQDQVILFNFYPRLRFNRETDAYRPNLPNRISILGRILRSDLEWSNQEEKKREVIRYLGAKFMYDPVEFSRDTFLFDRWDMIKPFKENRYFKEVHNSLNGLISYFQNQTKE